MDEALKPLVEVDHDHDFVPAADKIAGPHGAPKLEGNRRRVAVCARRDLRPSKSAVRSLDEFFDRPVRMGDLIWILTGRPCFRSRMGDEPGCGTAPAQGGGHGRDMATMMKPSAYDDDGYVIQWWLSTIPSNSLASVYGLLAACAQEKTLGPDVDIELEAYDECNKIIDVEAMAKRIKAGGGGFIGLVGVRSNQFPRAVDLARAFRALDVPVVIGGFHVSGCISMLPELPPDLKEAQALGVTLYAGEGEGRMADLLRDINSSQAKPLYNYLHDMPGMEAAAIPVLPKEVVGRIVGHHACSTWPGAGFPFQCSFCTIINVQGRKSRYRTADDVEAIVRANYAQGINHYFVTDDNFARNRNWEAILDRLIDLRENKGIPIKLILQVDTILP